MSAVLGVPEITEDVNPPLINVGIPTNEQVLVYFPGDGLALFLDDKDGGLGDTTSQLAPVARAVLVTRLRAFADLIEGGAL